MKLIFIICLLVFTIVNVINYVKNSSNIYINKRKIILNVTAIIIPFIIIFILLSSQYFMLILCLFIIGVIINNNEMSRKETKSIFSNSDGVVSDDEVPNKWIESSEQVVRDILRNDKYDNILYISTSVYHFTNKYPYYVLFTNKKKKLIIKGTELEVKIREKFKNQLKK